MLYILFLVLNLAFALLLFFFCVAFITGAPYVPSSRQASRKMIELAHIKRGDRIYDLGSGDGKLLFLAAQQGAVATGYEINPYLVLFTKIRTYFSPYRKNIHVHWKNFWHADIGDADAVFVYLIAWKMERLETLLRQRLKPGTRVISNSFIFPHLDQVGNDAVSHVYAFKT